MNFILLTIPLISAAAGWIIHKIVVSYIVTRHWPKKQQQITQQLASLAGNNFEAADITAKISDPSVMDRAMPTIEKHIDNFLNEKLQKEIPMLGMFIGNKTTDKVKEVFMTELKELFPVVMSEIVSNSGSLINVQKLIEDKLQEPSVQKQVDKTVSDQLKALPTLGLAAGFAIGLINLAIICLVNS